MEILDIVDENGIPTGRTVERGIAHRDGIRHRTAHVWIVRNEGGRLQILMQKRSMKKDSFPGRFDTSSAGHIPAGDEVVDSALRELQEELGIVTTAEKLHPIGTFDIGYESVFHGKIFKDCEKAFVFVYSEKVDESRLKLQEEELDAVEWFDLEYVYEESKKHNKKFCAPSNSLGMLLERQEEFL